MFQPIDLQPFISDWVSNKGNSESYNVGYDALLAFGSAVHDKTGMLVLAHAVYGWMPTILKSYNLDGLAVEDVRGGFLPAEPVLNNSWVGTSKMFHFLAPEVWPIWDSRVALHFGLPRSGQHNRREVYRDYADFLRAEAASCKNPTNYSNLRFLELCLFSARPAKKEKPTHSSVRLSSA
ncbi:hypothetical protein K3722_05105 [Leisingera caerulea]|uniref:Uncharacterized protein n=1 Tax=Leisingera caerulea TaxID=506591 RepID=A0ABY5WZB6_LEICA|nr:hypothetical protein [Leisingera caerulea]UWQ59508.1 hypothetical protein K3722_05105 [Leisingera caerulea]